jgi:hypothetical protein
LLDRKRAPAIADSGVWQTTNKHTKSTCTWTFRTFAEEIRLRRTISCPRSSSLGSELLRRYVALGTRASAASRLRPCAAQSCAGR